MNVAKIDGSDTNILVFAMGFDKDGSFWLTIEGEYLREDMAEAELNNPEFIYNGSKYYRKTLGGEMEPVFGTYTLTDDAINIECSRFVMGTGMVSETTVFVMTKEDTIRAESASTISAQGTEWVLEK